MNKKLWKFKWKEAKYHQRRYALPEEGMEIQVRTAFSIVFYFIYSVEYNNNNNNKHHNKSEWK